MESYWLKHWRKISPWNITFFCMLNAYLLHYFLSNPQVFSHKNTMLAGCIPQLLVKSYPIKRFMILKLYSNPFNDRYNPHFWLLSSGSLFWSPLKQVVWPFILTHESSMAVKSLISDYVIISYPINHHFPLWNPTLMVHLGVQGTILHGHWVTLDCNISRNPHLHGGLEVQGVATRSPFFCYTCTQTYWWSYGWYIYTAYQYILVGGFSPTPLKSDGVKASWDDDIPNWMEK